MSFFDIVKNLLFGGKGFTRGSVLRETEEKIQAEWANIQTLVAKKTPSPLRQALIAADKTLDNALRDIAKGETMAERLKNHKDKFDRYTYNKIWEAHKVRNNLVHESGYEPPYYVVIEAIESFRAALRSLNIKV